MRPASGGRERQLWGSLVRRELSDETALLQAQALRDYLARGGRGLAFWFKSKDLGPADRRAVLRALSREGARHE